MGLFEDLAAVSTPAGSLFHGTTPGRMMVLLQALADQQNLRTTTDGNDCSKTQQRFLSTSFCTHFQLTPEQYECITTVFDNGGSPDVRALFKASLPVPIAGVRPTYVRRSFAPDKNRCCARALRVRKIEATVIDVDDCYSAWHVVKECVGGCGAAYYLNKRVIPEEIDEEPCSWHFFYPWTDGRMPEYIANKSGKMIISTKFLRVTAIMQCTMRVGFSTIADLHARTVRRDGGADTTPLTGPVLTECWAIFCLLKHKQGVGPWLWFAPHGGEVVAHSPQEVGVVAMRGDQTGDNHWKGLRTTMTEVLDELSETARWAGHACDLCRKDIVVDEEYHSVKAAAVDGITATRHAKCIFHGCRLDLPGLGGQRFCAAHAEEVGHLCAVTTPQQCQNNHQASRLTCADHSHMEDTWRSHNEKTGWRNWQGAQAPGDVPEEEHIRLLRFMFAPRTTFGHFIGSYSCGIIAGNAPLWESEGMEEVDRSLNLIWRDEAMRPQLLFYDLACRRRRYLLNHPDPSWEGTINIVDRFHFRNHTEEDCHEFCNPERQDDPLLWHLDENNRPKFNWNSSVAESNNSFVAGLGPVLKKMPHILGQFVLSINISIHNELKLAEKLWNKNPTFIG